MITSPTLITTLDAALETAQIIRNILADEKLTYSEKYQLIDDILRHDEDKSS